MAGEIIVAFIISSLFCKLKILLLGTMKHSDVPDVTSYNNVIGFNNYCSCLTYMETKAHNG